MFSEELNKVLKKRNSLLCVGLDTDIQRIPSFLLSEVDPLFLFNREIIEATKDFVSAYKLNIAFYESLGIPGWELLERTLSVIPDEILLIADAKRGDIGNTSLKYAETFFKTYPFDAMTVSPFMGFDSVKPFLERESKGVFILCLTSNPGSRDFQRLEVDGEPLYLRIARKVTEWNTKGNCGLVVGATHSTEIEAVRHVAPNMPLLIPGIGAQGGDLEESVRFATDSNGLAALFNASRSIIYAGSGMNFAEQAGERAKQMRDKINMFVRIHKNPERRGKN